MVGANVTEQCDSGAHSHSPYEWGDAQTSSLCPCARWNAPGTGDFDKQRINRTGHSTGYAIQHWRN
ncbi:hypothetical protein AERO8C_150091 [Aeromonas veronii]|uniref:Uncharacterized protein n=1 Tax=Aeromonas veronii TaxID=654 RepID=A0A653KVM4_AERVE|nr:hypothetical protein AERO8C_150091 [Aeromonas veronii]